MSAAAGDDSEGERDWRHVLGLFITSRLVVAAVAVLGPLLLNPDTRFKGRITEMGWKAYVGVWDVGWYGNVASTGYRFSEGTGAPSNIAFFPLFPMVLRALNAMGLEMNTAGFLFSNASFGAALWLFFKIVLRETGERETAQRATALLAFSPAAVWFSLGLTESLFLLLTLALVSAAYRKAWGTMLVIGILAGLTRPNGFVLAVPALALAWLQISAALRERKWRSFGGLALVVSGPILGAGLFFVYLRIMFGSWSSFQKVNAAQWHNGISVSWETLAQRIPGLGLRLFDSPTIYVAHVAWSWTFVIVAGLIAAVALWEYRAKSWHGVMLATFFAFHAFLYQGITPVGPIARYAAVVPAFYVGLALFAEHRKWAQPAMLAACVTALVIQTAMVFGGYHLN